MKKMKKLILLLGVLVFVGAVPFAMAQEPEGDKWYDRIQIGGLVEIEAGFFETDFKDPEAEDEKGSDVDLATVELAVDVKIAPHVNGHVQFLYEEDEITVEEGFITLVGSEAFPAYLITGRQYIPFGAFDSHFITDPTTLVLGETNEGAVVAGYRIKGELLDLSLGVYNGKAQETGDDDAIDSFVAKLAVNPFEGLMLGASYTSNLAGSDSFNEVVVDPDNLESLVAGWSAHLTYEFLGRFKLIAEYVGALDDFKAGEIYDAGDLQERSPAAWNVELGFGITESLELAARYGGSTDGGAFLPEVEYGAILNWGFFKNTNLGLEYLHGEFENDLQTTDTITLQLAVEF